MFGELHDVCEAYGSNLILHGIHVDVVRIVPSIVVDMDSLTIVVVGVR